MSDDARRAAFECIMSVLEDDAYANIVLPEIVAHYELDSRDSAFATELAYGSLRMSALYDAVISKAANRDAESLDSGVRAILWLGAHQALSMRTPDHAAVWESVELAKGMGLERAKGIINAVMRRITERSLEQWLRFLAPGESVADIALRNSHPTWVAQGLLRSLAADGRPDALEPLLASHNEAAHVTLVARPGLADREGLAASVGGEPTPLSPVGVVLGTGSPGAVPEVASGAAAVQDEGSQVVALALASAAAKPMGSHERWLDACAGPGGKAALLGALAAQRGATLDALEVHSHRAGLVKGSVKALPEGTVTVHVADANTWEGGPYDRILVDAPCTGFGALRRRPEARFRRSSEDLADLTRLQAAILAHCASLLAPGGVIAYVTCSPLVEETTAIVDASGLETIDARLAVAEVTGTDSSRWGSRDTVQMWTDRDGTDSMFLAILSHPKQG